MYKALINNRVLGKHINNYVKYKAISKKSKIISLIFLWLTISVSIIVISKIYLKIILAIICVCVTIHLIKIKTIKKEND